MSLKDFFQNIDNEIATVMSSDFEIEIIETKIVPNFDDSNITFDNLDTKKKKCKRLETCVLYVDMRDSSKISAERRPKTLAKIYSSFVQSMIAAGRYFGGHIRNIIGDRVMVVFDTDDCFKKATDTAILMNSINKYILDKRIKTIDFKCGIGIDHGKMLITKAGAIRQGAEKEFYRSLVWLGKPANIASRLTDIAFKTETYTVQSIHQGNYYPYTKKWVWLDKTYGQFLDELEVTHSRNLRHKEEYFHSFFKTVLGPYSKSHSPILMTKAVYDGLKTAHPEEEAITEEWWTTNDIEIKDYTGDIYGGDIIFTSVKEI